MKIVQLTTDAREHHGDYGNPQPFFGAAPEALLQGFARLPEAQIHVVTCTRQPMQSPQKLADNIWFHSLHVPKSGWMRALYLGCTLAVRRKLKEIRPDLVHGQGTERDCAITAVLSGYPNVLTLHGNMAEMAKVSQSPPWLFHRLAARLENFALRRTIGVFCNSCHTEASVRPRARRVWQVPNAVREAVFARPINRAVSPRCVMLNVGVICEYKRQLEWLAVAQRLRQEGHDVEFHFLGQASPGSPYVQSFLKRVRSPEMQGVVSYGGFKDVDGLIETYDHATALVHVPTAETFGLVVAEGLARNLKLFAMAVGGIPDIASGVDGAELFPNGDWNGLREGIARWLRAGHVRPQNAAQVMRQRYQPEVIARRHLEIYREVLSTRS